MTSDTMDPEAPASTACCTSETLSPYRARALRLRRDRYLTCEDLDDEARGLRVRTQGAIDAVLHSEVHNEGLLDSVEKKPPRTADYGQDWLPPIDGEPVVRFRVRLP